MKSYNLEMLKLYDISSISFTDDENKFKKEIIEKATRILGATRIAIFIINNNERYAPLCIWGYDNYKNDCLTPEKIKSQKSDNTFIFEFDSGFISFENSSLITYKEQKLYNIFSKRLEDIIKRIQYRKYLEYLSIHDTLTGLYNRAYLEDAMKRLDTLRQIPMSIVMIDLNGLKLINDTYGHSIGDEFIKSLGKILNKICRKEDIVGRWGGDEFIILLPQTTKEKGRKICERINKACEDVHIKDFPVSVSFGIGTKEYSGSNLNEFLKEADNEMYKKKLSKSNSSKSALLKTLLETLGTKSYETKTHFQRMLKNAIKIGKEFGLSDTELNRLQLLINLHDIGKINIPGETLIKKTALTDKEWAEVKKHPEIGYRITRATDEFSHVAEDILSHHERWDGKGYPRGLKEKEIPILARKTAIVDAYDVMSNGRPYKDAMSLEEIISEFERCSGTQFDPELVDIFVNILRQEVDNAVFD